MIKIESQTLEEAYKNAALALGCSASELIVEVVQYPSSGFMGLFKKGAIIVATKKSEPSKFESTVEKQIKNETLSQDIKSPVDDNKKSDVEGKKKQKEEIKNNQPYILNDTIMPQSFVSTQDDENYDMSDINFMADYEEEEQKEPLKTKYSSEKPKQSDDNTIYQIAKDVESNINRLFNLTCFQIDKIKVGVHDNKTLLIEIKGEDAALLIGKEGYRYKALSYIIYNWINSKYQLQLRLEIAEFLKNQEDSIYKYLESVCEIIDRDGRAQTKILDGVLIQIALKELRDRYADKYVAIRSTRDGLKFIIINDYHN